MNPLDPLDPLTVALRDLHDDLIARAYSAVGMPPVPPVRVTRAGLAPHLPAPSIADFQHRLLAHAVELGELVMALRWAPGIPEDERALLHAVVSGRQEAAHSVAAALDAEIAWRRAREAGQ